MCGNSLSGTGQEDSEEFLKGLGGNVEEMSKKEKEMETQLLTCPECCGSDHGQKTVTNENVLVVIFINVRRLQFRILCVVVFVIFQRNRKTDVAAVVFFW